MSDTYFSMSGPEPKFYEVTITIPVYAHDAEHAREQVMPYIKDMRVTGVEIAKVEEI